jgi:hypothetical protein
VTPEQRSLRARLAAHARWAKCDDPVAATETARRALAEKWERLADPNGTLSPEDRARRAAHLQAQHMTGMALKSSISRGTGKRAKPTTQPEPEQPSAA